MTLKGLKQSSSVIKVKIESPISNNDLQKVLDALEKTDLEVEVTFSAKSMIIILPAKLAKEQFQNKESLV